ncbi:NUDIX domain-containing protein [soil metagenome]
MGLMNHALFQVATKALLFDGEKLLVLITPSGYIDFPGGRVDASEVELTWPEALRREVSEEIGPEVKADIGRTLFVSKRQYTKDGQTNRIAAIFFECKYLGGDITTSEEHDHHIWMTPSELLATDRQFVSADEKTQLQAYFAQRSTL